MDVVNAAPLDETKHASFFSEMELLKTSQELDWFADAVNVSK